MLRSVAVARIQDGLGFASRQSDKIILRLQEAQRDLEKGKTLPRFLIQTRLVVLAIGDSTSGLPGDFLRHEDSSSPYYVSSDGGRTKLRVLRDRDTAYDTFYSGNREAPRAMWIHTSNAASPVLDFINPVDGTYTIFWDYYQKADILSSDIENAWLANAPDWLIGEAGWRMAMDARDKDAVTIFDNLRKSGRMAIFGEIIAQEDSSGPLVMGANL